MRKSVELDHLLENAVAAALGLPEPHPQPPGKLRASRARASRRRQTPPHARREHASEAA